MRQLYLNKAGKRKKKMHTLAIQKQLKINFILDKVAQFQT